MVYLLSVKDVTTFGKLFCLPSSSSFLLTCLKTTTRNELARLGMGTIFLVSHVYGNSRLCILYVRLFLIRMRALVFCELNSRARKRNDFLA